MLRCIGYPQMGLRSDAPGLCVKIRTEKSKKIAERKENQRQAVGCQCPQRTQDDPPPNQTIQNADECRGNRENPLNTLYSKIYTKRLW